jgi:hypothetical protein
VWGITAMAVVSRFPGMVKINSLKDFGFRIHPIWDLGFGISDLKSTIISPLEGK